MSEQMIATIVGGGVSLITTIVTWFIKALIEKHKCQMKIQQKRKSLRKGGILWIIPLRFQI